MPSIRKYYGHPLWRTKVETILRRDSHTCRQCGARENLQVHHLKYVRGRMPWEYPDEVFVTLCDDCHILQTAKQRRRRANVRARWRRRRFRGRR